MICVIQGLFVSVFSVLSVFVALIVSVFFSSPVLLGVGPISYLTRGSEDGNTGSPSFPTVEVQNYDEFQHDLSDRPIVLGLMH